MGGHAPRRHRVGLGTLGFAALCLVASTGAAVATGVDSSVGASGVAPWLPVHAAAQPESAPAPVPQHQTAKSPGSGTPDTTVATTTTTSTTLPAAPPPAAPTTTVPTAPPAAPAAAPVDIPAPPTPSPAAPVLAARGAATVYGCTAALAYLAAYSAPGFTFQCPGGALGHQAMTCIDEPGVCDNEHLIAIADPCPAAYMNEASNSWVLTGAADTPIDPYGACS
jgi:hypothetical protein